LISIRFLSRLLARARLDQSSELMTFSRRLTLKRAILGGHLATAVLKIKYFRSSGPSIPAGIQLESPLGRAEISRLQFAFRPVIPWAP
jgi:hypothetical protein